jgi:hypothetical protein
MRCLCTFRRRRVGRLALQVAKSRTISQAGPRPRFRGPTRVWPLLPRRAGLRRPPSRAAPRPTEQGSGARPGASSVTRATGCGGSWPPRARPASTVASEPSQPSTCQTGGVGLFGGGGRTADRAAGLEISEGGNTAAGVCVALCVSLLSGAASFGAAREPGGRCGHEKGYVMTVGDHASCVIDARRGVGTVTSVHDRVPATSVILAFLDVAAEPPSVRLVTA